MLGSRDPSAHRHCKRQSAVKLRHCTPRSLAGAPLSRTYVQRDVLKTVTSLCPWTGMTSRSGRGGAALRVTSRVTSWWLCGVVLVLVWTAGRADDYNAPPNASGRQIMSRDVVMRNDIIMSTVSVKDRQQVSGMSEGSEGQQQVSVMSEGSEGQIAGVSHVRGK
ncbi:hypothetical protein ACOMHN_060476 [Nucella lapillus]